MQHPLDWDDLRVFLAVSDSRSLGDAAARLGIHRSTVLRRIERLEDALGNRLVARGHDGVALTGAGERLVRRTERMADEASGILGDADIDHGRPAGVIRVAASLNLSFGLLPPFIARFRETYPEIAVDLTATPDGFSPVHPEDVDIAFRALAPDSRGHENMIGRRLGALPVAIFGARSYLERHGTPRSGAGLAGHRIVSLVESFASLPSMGWLAAQPGLEEPVYRASSMLLLLAAVRAGIGIACLPSYLGAAEPALDMAFELAPEHGADLWILRHPHLRESARMRAFSEFMASAIPPLL